MGREVCKSVLSAADLRLVGAVDVRGEEQDVGVVVGAGETGVLVANDLEEELERKRPDVMVDFTRPDAAAANVKAALCRRVRPVVGTTGMGGEELQEIVEMAEKLRIGGIVAPNFAIGAVLMIHFAAEAAKYFPCVEIIELHHDQKLDAPSGTALATAGAMLRVRGGFGREPAAAEVEKLPGARGGLYEGGVRVHSVRLPGLVAHQEVIFGGLGQTLTIRHDSISRESFMPGVQLAIPLVKVA
ncbi:MAG: 4-hydroxy-tetrahydrodipicolinate reductase [Armatimonadetes bacterium]|nr:4-hydroxy-tetrahydrodipicolinate reductase [Armatimonadota bacterium]